MERLERNEVLELLERLEPTLFDKRFERLERLERALDLPANGRPGSAAGEILTSRLVPSLTLNIEP
jgi:hypothetical protein